MAIVITVVISALSFIVYKIFTVEMCIVHYLDIYL